ncbi:MAG: carbohydrate ABC transporter permease [Armatimonadetes bacterium]|nr:carbohydrate ABC transporter permease [Armatimonadota bacterium]
MALFLTGPFVWLLITSLKTGGNIFQLASFSDFLPSLCMQHFGPVSVPFPCFDNFISTLRDVPLIPRFFGNTVWICLWGVLGELLIASLAAYPLARLEFPGKTIIFTALLATMMIPAQANMIVNFVTIRKLGLFDSYAAIVLPSMVTVFGIFLLRQAYLVIPGELEDAARIDGCSELAIWYRIMLPLVRPALATLAIFTFVSYWNTFMWPLVVLKHEAKYPLAVGLSHLANMFSSNFRVVAAGSVLSMIPVIVLFLCMQKQFIKGITAGAVK